MDIKNFMIELYVLFLGITLTVAIEKIVEEFSYFSLVCFILIFFLAIDFFFAKAKDIGNKEEKLSGLNLTLNLLVVGTFAFLPYFMTSFMGTMLVLLFLRVADFFLILDESFWDKSLINTQNKRWLLFDISYFVVELIFVLLYSAFCSTTVANVLITIYLIMGIFEAVFDFVVNSGKYLSID